MAPKSIFRQPGAQHFQVVHRSQRDPLIHDPEASQHVLKAFERDNAKKGKSKAELEDAILPGDLAHDTARPNIGEATLYDIYYDDTDYDYMQHLRQIGDHADGVDSILLEAPSRTKKNKDKGEAIELRAAADIPAEALPSRIELAHTYESQLEIPSEIEGFRPDMDPHLRQVLEALEDDAFVDDDLANDFFDELVVDGERAPEDDIEFEFREEGFPEGVDEAVDEPNEPGDDEGWEARFANFKKNQQAAPRRDDGSIILSEGADTVGNIPQFSVVGGKKRGTGGSDATGYSMSSSALFRNKGLSLLDDQFDRIEREYTEDDSDEEYESAEDNNDYDEAPQLLTTREDFESMMDDFLDKFEIVGNKMRPVLEGDTPADKLNTVRRALGEVPNDVRTGKPRRGGDNDDGDILMPYDIDDRKERWDCETILSTYTNVENHPRLIRVRDAGHVPRIRLDPKTGLPTVNSGPKPKRRSNTMELDVQEEEEDNLEAGELSKAPKEVLVRPRNESKEDKKVRKQAIKEERQTRRVAKKAMQETFSSERKSQIRQQAGKNNIDARKL